MSRYCYTNVANGVIISREMAIGVDVIGNRALILSSTGKNALAARAHRRVFMRWGRKTDPTFLTLLERSANFAVEAADALVELFAGEITESTFAGLDTIEHRADANTH